MIQSVETAISLPLPSTRFYEYLTYDLKDKQGLLLFSLYTDLKHYLTLCQKFDQLSVSSEKGRAYEQRKELAFQIYKDYLLEGAPLEIGQNKVTEHLLKFWDNGIIVGALIDECLFSNLVLFAYGGLNVYWQMFLKSKRYKMLVKEVSAQEQLY